MAEPRLTQVMKRHAIIVSLAAGHSDSDNAAFLKVDRSFVFKVRRELEAVSGDVETVSSRKQYCQHSDRIRKSEFITFIQVAVDADPGKSMRAFAREMQVDEATIRRVVHEDLRYKSYVMRRGQFMSARTRESRVIRAKRLLNKLKHRERPGMLWFFSNEKNFVQDQKVKALEEVPTIMHAKFPTSVMVLGVVSNEGDMMIRL